MGIFRRKSSERHDVPGHPDLVEIDAAAGNKIVKSMGDEVYETMRRDIPGEILEILALGFVLVTGKHPKDIEDSTRIAGQTAARFGYVSRRVEVETSEIAREGGFGDPGLRRVLIDHRANNEDPWSVTFAEVAASLATVEPLDPGPDDIAATWIIEGIGGSFRSALADYVLLGIGPPRDDGHGPILPPGTNTDELKRIWKYGFFIHAFQEAMPEAIGY